jgi:hypothetical protein
MLTRKLSLCAASTARCWTRHGQAYLSLIDSVPWLKQVNINCTLFLLRHTNGLLVDLIIVLKDGQVAEQGTHEELLRLGGLYHHMWVQQASDNLSESLIES